MLNRSLMANTMSNLTLGVVCSAWEANDGEVDDQVQGKASLGLLCIHKVGKSVFEVGSQTGIVALVYR